MINFEYDCESVELKLNEILDRRSEPGVSRDTDSDPAWAEHLQQCAACRKLVDDYRNLFVLIRPKRHRSAHASTLKTAVAIAAVFVLFVLPAGWSLRESWQTSESGYLTASAVTRLEAELSAASVASDLALSDERLSTTSVTIEDVSTERTESITSVLNIGAAFNTFAANTLLSEQWNDTETIQEVSGNPAAAWVNRSLGSRLFVDSSAIAESGGESAGNEARTFESALTSLKSATRPIEFEPPSFKSMLRVCANPFSDS